MGLGEVNSIAPYYARNGATLTQCMNDCIMTNHCIGNYSNYIKILPIFTTLYSQCKYNFVKMRVYFKLLSTQNQNDALTTFKCCFCLKVNVFNMLTFIVL